MSNVLSAVRSYIIADAVVSAMISSRLYFDRLPQNVVYPAMLVSQVSSDYPAKLSDRVCLVSARMQFDAFSATRATSDAISQAVVESGILAHKGVTDGVDIRAVSMDVGLWSSVVDDIDGGDDHTYVTSFDLLVTYVDN